MKITRVNPRKKTMIPCKYVTSGLDGQSQSGHCYDKPPESGIVIALDPCEALVGSIFISRKDLKKYAR